MLRKIFASVTWGGTSVYLGIYVHEEIHIFSKSLRDGKILPCGLADGQYLWSITADRSSNNSK